MKYYTTLKEIRQHDPCRDNFNHFVESLGSGWSETKKIPTEKILGHSEKTGLDDLLWCFDGNVIHPKREAKKMIMLFSADCAERVLPNFEKEFPDDSRVRDCINGIRDYVADKITKKRLSTLARSAESAAESAASSAAWSAARSATRSAESAAWSAAWSAAKKWQLEKLIEYLSKEDQE